MLRPQAVTGHAGAIGFDTDTKLTLQTATSLRRKGYQFCLRYLSLGSQSNEGDLDSAETTLIIRSGLALMPVQHVRPPGWIPTETLGRHDGHAARVMAYRAGIPAHVNVWLDLEGIRPHTKETQILAYCNAWFDSVHAWGYLPGIYVGADCGLSSDALYHGLNTRHYWKSASTVPEPAVRGFQMRQTTIDKVCSGIIIDENVLQVDNLGDQVCWLSM